METQEFVNCGLDWVLMNPRSRRIFPETAGKTAAQKLLLEICNVNEYKNLTVIYIFRNNDRPAMRTLVIFFIISLDDDFFGIAGVPLTFVADDLFIFLCHTYLN